MAEADLFPDILEGHLLAKFTKRLSLSQRALKDTCGPGDAIQSSERSLPHLRGGEDHCPIDVRHSQILDHREVFIRGARWGVYDEVVYISPVYVTEELLDQT